MHTRALCARATGVDRHGGVPMTDTPTEFAKRLSVMIEDLFDGMQNSNRRHTLSTFQHRLAEFLVDLKEWMREP